MTKHIDILEQEYRAEYQYMQDDIGPEVPMLPSIPVVATMEPNYTIITGPLEALCECFRMYTGSGASIAEIKKSFEKRQKKNIQDAWMTRFFEAVRKMGPTHGRLRTIEAHNKVPLIGRAEICKALAGTAATLNANYIALGSGSNAPADGDTTLQTEFVRGGFTQTSATGNVVYLDKFFWSVEVGNKTILEAGIFMGATGTVNSGVLLSRVNLNETMTANETMTINATITINSAT